MITFACILLGSSNHFSKTPKYYLNSIESGQCMNMPMILYSSESKLLGEKLRAIGDELIRSADILEGKIDDTIHVFNEQVGKMEKDIESKNLQKSTFK